jgi:hypothetical protein
MSYDVAIWGSKRPLTVEEAVRIYAALTNADCKVVAPDRRVSAFYKQLCATYPSLDAPNKAQAARSPWTANIDVSNNYVLLPIAFSRVKGVLPTVVELARSLGLVCFDPQGPRLSQEVPAGTASRSVLQTEDGSVMLSASTESIAQQVSKLRVPQNSFVILERGRNRFIQAQVNARQKWVIECRDGAADRHYRALKPSLQDVVRCFVAFADRTSTLKDAVEWKQVTV